MKCIIAEKSSRMRIKILSLAAKLQDGLRSNSHNIIFGYFADRSRLTLERWKVTNEERKGRRKLYEEERRCSL